MGNDVSTEGLAAGDGVSVEALRNANKSVPTSPMQLQRTRTTSSARTVPSTGEKSDNASPPSKRRVLVGAKMGDCERADHPPTASTGRVAVSRSAPVSTATGGGRGDGGGVASGIKGRVDSVNGLGSTSELYSVVSIMPEEKSAQDVHQAQGPSSRRTSAAAAAAAASGSTGKRQSATISSGTTISARSGPRAAPPTLSSAALARKTTGTTTGSGTSFNGSEMEFRPSDVNAFFEGSTHSHEAGALTTTDPGHTQGITSSSAVVARDGRAPFTSLSAAVSPLSRSAGNVRGGGGGASSGTSTSPALPRSNSVLSSHEEGDGLRRRGSRRGTSGKTNSPGTDKVKVAGSEIQIRPARRGNTSMTTTTTTAPGSAAASEPKDARQALAQRRNMVPATAALNHNNSNNTRTSQAAVTRGRPGTVPTLQRSSSRTSGGSQLVTLLPTSSAADTVGMGSLYGSKTLGSVGTDNDGFYGTSKGVTSLYASGIEHVQDLESSGRPDDAHAATSLYRTEQPLMFNSSLSQLAKSTRSSGREAEGLSSPHLNPMNSNGSFFAMRDQSYSSSATTSHAASQVNRHMTTSTTTPMTTTNVPQSPLSRATEAASSKSHHLNNNNNNSNNSNSASSPGTTGGYGEAGARAREDKTASSSTANGGGVRRTPTSSHTANNNNNNNNNNNSFGAGDLPTAISTSSLFKAKSGPKSSREAGMARAKAEESDSLAGSSSNFSSVGAYDLGDGHDLSRDRPRRTGSNELSRAGSRDSHRSLTDSVASSAASSRSSSVSSTVSRRDVGGLQRRAAAAHSSTRSPGASVSGNFQGRYMNAGVRKRSGAPGASDDVLHSPAGEDSGAVEFALQPPTPTEGSGGLYRGLSSSARRRRGSRTTFAEDGEDEVIVTGSGRKNRSANAAHDAYNKFFTRTNSQNGISTDGSGATKHTGDDDTSLEQRENKANILVQLANNTSGGSSTSQNGSGRGTPFRPARPPATSFQPLTITQDRFKMYQQAYGL